MKRYICCGALPQLAGSCDPYLCLDVGKTRYAPSWLVTPIHQLQPHGSLAETVASSAANLVL
jgi:hypothetical protein